MNVWYFPFALIGFMGFVMVMPGWMHFLGTHSGNLSTEGQFLISLVLPATVLLYIVSWIQPGGAN
jgi:hypothetical protein